MKFDVLIKNGLLYDGTGGQGFRADLGIRRDRIEAIGDLSGSTGSSVIDAAGRIVCPGFIDTHSHSGILALCKPDTPHNVMQGITTCVVGQDAMGAAPMVDGFVGPWKKAMAGLEGSYDLDWSWRSTADYLDRLDAMGLGPNFAYLAPHGNIRMSVMGLDNRQPTPAELERMKVLLR